MRSFSRILLPVIILLLVVFTIGTIGYSLLEGWPLLDSLYMTAITLTTVGFGEVRPLTNYGRIFTIILLILGVGTIAYGLGTIGEYLLASDIGPILRRRQNRRMINKMQDHIIVCGYGRVGRSAVANLIDSEQDVVVIDIDRMVVGELREKGLSAIYGDATDDDVLREAGIERAKGVIVCGGSEADNLYIVLSARTLNPDLTIVTRSIDPANEDKMLRAGADRVISPYQIGGQTMADVMTRPGVTDFFRLVTLDSGLELWLEELEIKEGSELAGQTVIEADLRRRTGAVLVGLLRKSSGEILTPNETTRLEAADLLISLGTRDQLRRLEKLISGTTDSK
jgi:voltage-gated potassium channel